MILAIETSTNVCSVALGNNGRCITEKRIQGKGVHSEYTFTFLNELTERFNCTPENLESVLFSNGPGSYTGLRIGAAAIKGFLFDRDVPLYTFPTLLSFSVPFADHFPSEVHAIIDARRQHLYHQKITFDEQENMKVSDEEVVEIENLQKQIKDQNLVVGTGFDRLKIEDNIDVKSYGLEVISASNLINGWYNPAFRKYFKHTNPENFEPEYLTIAQINNSDF